MLIIYINKVTQIHFTRATWRQRRGMAGKLGREIRLYASGK